MGTLKEDIDEGADWIVKAFKADGVNLDYSIRSFIEIDKFFNKNVSNGKAKRGGRLSKNAGNIIFSITAYIGNTIIKNVRGSFWVIEGESPKNIIIKLPDQSLIFPAQRVVRRFKNGDEDSIYVYGHQVAKDFTKESFDDNYWNEREIKSWWRFW